MAGVTGGECAGGGGGAPLPPTGGGGGGGRDAIRGRWSRGRWEGCVKWARGSRMLLMLASTSTV